MNSTFSNNNDISTASATPTSTLTIEVLQEAIKKLEALPKRPFFLFSAFCQADMMLKGPKLDEMADGVLPDFNAKFHELIILNPAWKDFLEEKFKGLL